MTHNQLIKNTQNLKGVSISKIEESTDGDTLYIHIKLHKRLRGICPHCHKHVPGYDSKTQERQWRALDMGTKKVILVSDVHRVKCPEHGVGTERLPGPGISPGSQKNSSSRLPISLFITLKNLSVSR